MADNDFNNSSYFQPIDVSEPRAPRKEIDIIEEELAIRRRAWIRTHMTYLFAAAGVLLVALIVLSIHFYDQSTNPMSRFVSASAKNFGTPFNFTVVVSENGEPEMTYTGAIDVKRSTHEIKALYDATYERYFFRGAVYADDRYAMAGSLYDGRWVTHDCVEKVLDFFDFDADYRNGGFDGGAFLRFADIASDYSTRETNRLVGIAKQRLSTNSDIASFTVQKEDKETRYDYTINLYALYEMVEKDGASLFYRAPDYNAYVARFELNKDILKKADCKMHFVINAEGYMTEFSLEVTASGVEYALSCTMSDFGEAYVEIPEAFYKAAAIVTAEE